MLARGATGFLIALAIWYGASIPYARLLASMSEVCLRISERPAITSIVPRGTTLAVVRRDFRPPPSGAFAVESTDVTFNFILMTTLFAATRRVASDRNVFGFAAACAALFAVHVAAVVAFVKSYYAFSFGSWSTAHFGVVARSLWGAAPFFYSVVGVYAFPFALWWLLSGDGSETSRSPRARRRG